MSKYHDDRTAASDPLPITVAPDKLRQFHPQLLGWRSWFTIVQLGRLPVLASSAFERITEHVRSGDSRAALVMQVRPLLVAAYTDEQDAVLLLQFPDHLVDEYGLCRGSQLLTINTYEYGWGVVRDISEGPASTHRYANFYPIIADFISDDYEIMELRQHAISTNEWDYTWELAAARLAQPQVWVRDGRPLYSSKPGKLLERG